jgi:G3E family GTPase
MARARIPVTLVTGYLGSGKTTLVNRFLRDADGARIAVLVNEFGAVGIDGALIAPGTGEGMVVELANGCLCCVVAGRFREALAALAPRAADLDHIVIETSGAADPTSVIKTLWGDPELTRRFRLDGAVCVADAERFLDAAAADPVVELQAAVADAFLVTKIDRAGAAARESLVQRLSALNPSARVFDAPGSRELLRLDAYRRPAPAAFIPVGATPHAGLTGVSDSWDGTVERAALQEFFRALVTPEARGGFAERVLRVKALLHVTDEERPWLVQGVQNWIEKQAAPRGYAGPNRLVVLGRGLDEARLRQAIERLRGARAPAARV